MLRAFLRSTRVAFPAACLAAVVFARTEIPNAAQPQLTVATDGRVWLVYGQMETAASSRAEQAVDHAQHAAKHGSGAAKRPGAVFVACSNDGGETFGPATKVGVVPGLMLGMRRGPRIAAQGDRLTITVIGEELFALTSADAGRTWSAPVVINSTPRSAMEGLHDLAAAPDGELFVTWLDMRNGRMELWGAESADAGRTWSRNQRVHASPDKSICECCHPTALFDAQGNLAVMWRNSIAGARDMWRAIRRKGAQEFAPAMKLGAGTWQLNACPMDGGRLVALGDGKFAAVWQRAGEVFFVPPDGPELRLGQGRQPLAVIKAGSPAVLWQDGSNLVSLRDPGKGSAVRLAADARFAVAVALPDATGAVIAYERGAAADKQPGIVIERW